jgi:Tol biopolymer transport system component
MPDGDFIIFPSQRAGSMTLWRIAPEGGLPPEPVLTSAGEDTEPEISRDGRKLIFTNKRSNYSVIISNPAAGESRTLRETRGVTVDASFSPDGNKILFFGISEAGDLQIFSINADGSNLTQITQKKGERNIHPQWSADGQTVYFYQIHPVLSFRQIPATGGESTELVHGWQWGEQNGARVSADARRIIYSKLDKGAVISTKIRNLQDQTETAFSTTLRHPRWSHNSRFVVGTDLPERRWDLAGIVVCSVEVDNCRRLAQGYNPHWSADDSQIYYYRFSDLKNGEELWRISVTGENEEKVMDLQPMEPIGNFFDVSPNGEIVWIKYERGKNELWMADFPAN